MEDTTLSMLRFLTNNLPPVPTLEEFKSVSLDGATDHIIYNIIGGICHSYVLFSSPEISVARTFVSAGGEFPEHLHNETEYVLFFSGSALVRVGGEERVYKERECVIFDPKTPHWSKALEDTWFIAMTIPYSKDYPE